MASARTVWPDVPADWDPKSPGDADWFVIDCTDKLAERSGAAISGTPTFAAFLPSAPTTPVSDLTFSTAIVGPNAAGLANQIVSVKISGGTDGAIYKVTMTFTDTAQRTLERSQLLAVSDR